MLVNGNRTTALMHLLAWTELQRLRVTQTWPITKLRAEQTVVLNTDTQTPREGKFDFYAETPSKTIGFEVLTRPSRGKLLKKFAYRNEVDEFVFILPSDSMTKYQRKETNGRHASAHFKLPKLFGEKGLYAWLVDLDDQRIIAKKPFSQLFHVDENGHALKNGKKPGKRR